MEDFGLCELERRYELAIVKCGVGQPNCVLADTSADRAAR
jgi:hypothetical protein